MNGLFNCPASSKMILVMRINRHKQLVFGIELNSILHDAVASIFISKGFFKTLKEAYTFYVKTVVKWGRILNKHTNSGKILFKFPY